MSFRDEQLCNIKLWQKVLLFLLQQDTLYVSKLSRALFELIRAYVGYFGPGTLKDILLTTKQLNLKLDPDLDLAQATLITLKNLSEDKLLQKEYAAIPLVLLYRFCLKDLLTCVAKNVAQIEDIFKKTPHEKILELIHSLTLLGNTTPSQSMLEMHGNIAIKVFCLFITCFQDASSQLGQTMKDWPGRVSQNQRQVWAGIAIESLDNEKDFPFFITQSVSKLLVSCIQENDTIVTLLEEYILSFLLSEHGYCMLCAKNKSIMNEVFCSECFMKINDTEVPKNRPSIADVYRD